MSWLLGSEGVVNETEVIESSPRLQLMPSRQFPSWLASTGASLAFTTYQASKLLLVGSKTDGGLSFFERTFERPMGLAGDGRSLWLAALWQL